MKKLMLIAMGGTISGVGDHRLDLKDYRSGSLSGEDILQALPEAKELAHIDIETFPIGSSTGIKPSDWILLRERIHYYLNEAEYDGIVIMQGTSTMEETAYFLHLTVNSNKPVVLTGAQRPFSALSSDAQLNLVNAIRVAIADTSMNKGAVVVINDQIHSARNVVKAGTYLLDAFRSGHLGQLGYADADGSVQYYSSPERKHTIHSEFASISFTKLPNVEIVYSYAGANGDLIRYITDSGRYDGIVTAGTGGGRSTPEEEEALQEAVAAGLVVVRSTRVGEGRVLPIKSFQRFPSVCADNLSPQKARILLMLSLLKHKHPSDLQRIFDTY